MATAQTERSPQGFRSDVQGLRAVAVGLVILYHFGLFGAVGGYVGVDVFFVISGFVIAGLIFRETASTGKLSLRSFYARRARRILPASTVTLVVTVAAAVWLFGRLGAYSVAQDAVASALFVANFHFAAQGTNYFANALPPSPLLHFWSLAVEEQFYFVFPSLVALVALSTKMVRRHVLWIVGVIAGASFLWSVAQTAANPTSAYFSIATRAWELGLGVLCAGVIHRFGGLRFSVARVITLVGAAAIAISAWVFNATTPYPGSVAALPVVGAAFIILGGAGQRAPLVTRVLSTRPFVRVGDVSYSLYLWHFPVIALASRYFPQPLSLAQRLGLLALAVGLSLLSYRIVEQPLRSSSVLRRHPGRSLGLGAACVATALVVSFVPIWSVTVRPAAVVKGHPALSQLHAAIVQALKARRVPAATDPALSIFLPFSSFGLAPMLSQCNPPTYVTTVPYCAFGDTHSRTTVVLYGNSQAQMWAPALDRLGRLDHFRLIPIAKPACGTFGDNAYIGPNGLVSPICRLFVRWSEKRINRLHPALVVIASTPGSVLRAGANPNAVGANGRLPSSVIVDPSPARTAHDFATFVRALRPSHAKLVLLSGIPLTYLHGGNLTPPGCLLANLSSVQRCTLRQPTIHDSSWLKSFTLAARQSHVPFIDVSPMLCAHDLCPAVINRVLVKFDALHLTGTYVTYAASALGELMSAQLPTSRHRGGHSGRHR